MMRIARGTLFSGNRAPERKKIGITRKFMTSWKPWKSGSTEAEAVPTAVNRRGQNHEARRPEEAMAARDVRKPSDQADARTTSIPCMHGDGGAAEGAADHDQDARHRGDQRFFQETELAVPDHLMPEKMDGEQDRHGDHAGRQELDVVALPGALEDRSEAESEGQQKQQRLAEGSR